MALDLGTRLFLKGLGGPASSAGSPNAGAGNRFTLGGIAIGGFHPGGGTTTPGDNPFSPPPGWHPPFPAPDGGTPRTGGNPFAALPLPTIAPRPGNPPPARQAIAPTRQQPF